MAQVNAFQKIKAPEPNRDDLMAFTRKVNAVLEELVAKVYGYIEKKDLSAGAQKAIDSKAESADLQKYSTITQTAEAIEAAVADLNMDQYSTITQTAAAIEAAVVDLNMDQYSTITQTAAAIEAKVEDLNLEQYSTITQTSDAIALAVSGKADASTVSSLSVTVNSINTTVNGENGLNSTVNQLKDRVAVEISKAVGTSTFRAIVGACPQSSSDIGLSFYAGSALKGGLYIPSTASSTDLSLRSGGALWLHGGGATLVVGQSLASGADSEATVSSSAILPSSSDYYRLGNSSYRWKRLFCNNDPDVSSDRRVKKDIEPLHMSDLLKRLVPRRFRKINDEGKLHFGFVAQEVKEALDEIHVPDADLFNGENPDHLSLVYGELIAVLVEGWQEHEKKISNLEARLAALEARI